MYGIEKRLKMRRHIEAGMSKSEAARVEGISRRTLYNWIKAGELERDPDDNTLRYGPRPPRPSKIDAYKVYIDRRLSDCPKLTAARLFREIRDDGYSASYALVKRYVRRVKQHQLEASGERVNSSEQP